MIIAFTGKKRTGKSTACAYLENKYGFTRVNFKDGLIRELVEHYDSLLREIACSYWGVSEKELLQHYPNYLQVMFDEKPPLIRKLMQSHGQIRRDENPEYWVNQWDKKITSFGAGVILITTDDCRHLNEFHKIKNRNGVVVRIVRADMIHDDTHISETEMDEIIPDYTIVCNGGDVEYLEAELDKIYNHAINKNLYHGTH